MKYFYFSLIGLLIISKSFGQCSDTYEPNNTSSTATNFFGFNLFSSPANGTKTAKITSGDQDWFYIGIDGPGYLTVDLTSLPSDYDMELYGIGGLSAFIAGSYNSGTTSEHITNSWLIFGSTQRYVKVYPHASSNFNTTLCYTLTINWTPCTIFNTTPTLFSPGTSSTPGTTISTLTPTLDWADVSGSTSYGVYVRDMTTNLYAYYNDCATSTSQLTLPSGSLLSGRTYRWNVQANYNCGTCVSNIPAPLYFTTSAACTPVSISTQPQSQTANVGSTATFSVGVSGTSPFLYFWYKNNVQIAGASSSSYTTPTLTTSDNGNTYYCIITNCNSSYQSVSNTVGLTVNPICNTPTTQASGITFSNVQPNQVTVNWNNGNGSKRVVKINNLLQFSNVPDGTDPSANPFYQGIFNQVVFNGTGNSVTVSNLQPATTYYFNVTEGNCTGTSSMYLNGGAANNPNFVTTTNNVLAPIANFSSSAPSVVVGQSISYYDLSSNTPTSWQWLIEREQSNGTTQLYLSASGPSPFATFFTPGCYKVTLTVSNSAGSNTLPRTCYSYVLPNSSAVIPEEVTRAQKYYQYLGADPVAAGTGDYTYSTSDLSMYGVGTNFAIKRYYHSRNSNIGVFGKGWTSNIESYVDLSDDAKWVVHHEDGHESSWSPYPGGITKSYFPEWGDSLSYSYNSGTVTLRYESQEGMVYTFSGLTGTRANIQSIMDKYNNPITFSYSGNNLQFIDLSGGRRYTVTVNGFGRITAVTDQSGRSLNSFYSADGVYLDSTSVATSTTRFAYTVGKLYAIVNPAGDSVVRNFYNGALQVIKQNDAYNRSTLFEYNTPSAGQTTITNPNTKKRIITSDANYRTVNIHNELGFDKKIIYNSQGLPDSVTNERGYGTKKYYDNHQNPVKTINAKGFADSLAWSIQNRPLYVGDYEGNKLNIAYNAQGSPIGVYMPHGVQKEILYDSRGLDTLTTDGNGYQTHKEYNSFGDLTKLSDFRGVWLYYYDAIGRLIAIKHPNNGIDSIFYNHFNQITKIKDPLGFTSQWIYNDNGVLISFIDKMGVATNYELNHIDNVIAIHQSGNRHTYITRDSLELPVKTIYPDGTTRSIVYDDAQSPLTITDSVNGLIKSLEYYEDGSLKSSTPFTGGTWQLQRDEISNVTDITAPNGNKQSYVRNRNSAATGYTDTKRNTTTYLLDSLGRTKKTTDPLSLSIQSYFGKRNTPDSVKDANSIITKNTFDLAGRITSHFDGAETWFYEWDAENNLTKTTLPDGTVIERFYNLRNEPTEVKVNGVTVQRFFNNANGLLDSITFIAGRYLYERNTLNEITKQTDHLANEIRYEHDVAGRLDTITYPGGKKVIYFWPDRNKCIVTDWYGKQYTVFYNNEEKRTNILYPNNNQTQVTFNQSLELVTQKNWGKLNNLPASFYQTNLNRYDSGYFVKDSGMVIMPLIITPPVSGGTYEKGDKQKTWDGYSYSYDKSGNRVSEIKSAPVPEINYFTHNWANLCTAYRYKGDSVQNTYDAFGSRIKKVNLTRNTTEQFVLDREITGWPVLLQKRDGTNTELYSILYAPDGTPLMIDSSSTIRYYQWDYLGNSVSLSDNTGNITDKYRSDRFGKYATQTGNSAQPFSWQGKFNCYQEAKDLYLLGGGVRLYDSKSHRFLEPDPLGGSSLNTQTSNLYTFGLNNPTTWNDPTGMEVAQNNTSYQGHPFDIRDWLPFGWFGQGLEATVYANELNRLANEAIARGDYQVALDLAKQAIDVSNKGIKNVEFGAITQAAGLGLGTLIKPGAGLLRQFFKSSLGSTGRNIASNLSEQLALQEIEANPQLAEKIIESLSDPRWVGWSKFQYVKVLSNGSKVVIHFVGKIVNGVLKRVDDFKFINN